MKKLKAWLSEIFELPHYEDISLEAIATALNEPRVRAIWLEYMTDELKRIHLEIDKRLVEGSVSIGDLGTRRRAYQDTLQYILSAKRAVSHDPRHNQQERSFIDLDRLTA
jgi:hypothetical protein